MYTISKHPFGRVKRVKRVRPSGLPTWAEAFDPGSSSPLGEFGGLGAAEVSPALAEYVRSAKALQGVMPWNTSYERDPENWKSVAQSAVTISNAEYKTFLSSIKGQTGNPEAEDKLGNGWLQVNLSAVKVMNSEPSWISLEAAKLSVFMQDFWGGAVSAWQDYSAWIIRNAGDTLRRFYDARVRVRDLSGDLKNAGDNVKPEVLSSQAEKISSASAALDFAAKSFSVASGGGDLDSVAQQEYGTYPTLGAFPIFAVAIAVAIVAAAVTVAYGLAMALSKIGAGLGDAAQTIVIVGGIALVAFILLRR